MNANTAGDLSVPTLPVLADKPVFEPILQPSVSSALGKNQQIFALNLIYPRTTEHFTEPSAALKTPKITLFCEECGHQFDVLQNDSGRTSVGGNRKRLKKLLNKYGPSVALMKTPKLLTLTSPRFSDPRRGILKMRAAFKKLRRREPFNLFFKDMIYGFHIKTKPNNEFNVHVHALVDTPYIHQAKLAASWSKCLPGAKVVDIRKCETGESGLNYILKDVVKAKDLYGFDKEIGASLKGSRLVQTAGSRYGVPAEKTKYPCPRCGSVSWTRHQEDAGKLVVYQERKRMNSQEVIIPYG